tara:strand:- start:464 stop:1063 length:600 start_codon:yes stop_codon:yes gene_type:complete
MSRFAIVCFSLLCAPLLAGCVSSALSAAGDVVTVAGQERSFGNAVDDATIVTEIHHYYLQNDVNDILINVGVTSHEGRVLLTGNVNTHEAAVNAVRLAWQAKGVKEVINEIEVRPETGPSNRAKDEWIEKQIEGRMLITKDIKSLNYTVEVVNAIAYILGIAQDDAELQRVFHITSTTKGVKRVVSHVRLKDGGLREAR